VKINTHDGTVEKSSPKFLRTCGIFQKMSKLNYHPVGEISPNLGTQGLKDFLNNEFGNSENSEKYEHEADFFRKFETA
jgi:hypothetical protein